MLIFTEFHGFSTQSSTTFEQDRGKFLHQLAAKVEITLVLLVTLCLLVKVFFVCMLDQLSQ